MSDEINVTRETAETVAGSGEIALEEQLALARKDKVEISESDFAEAMAMAEEIGKVKMAQAMSSGLNLSIIRWFDSMKSSKRYKGKILLGPDGRAFRPETFEELCDGMGFSRGYIYDNLQNFAALGERYLEEAQLMGLKVRDLRKVRKALKDAPEERREELFASLRHARDSSEDLKTALDVVCEQYAAAKTDNKKLETRIGELEADKERLKQDYEAQGKVLITRNEQYDEINEKLIRATSPQPADQEVARAEFLENAKKEVDMICLKATHAINEMGMIAEKAALDERADAALKLYVNERVSLAIRDMGMLLRDRLLDIDIESEFKSPEFADAYREEKEEE